MKQVLCLGLFLNAAFLGMWLWKQTPAADAEVDEGAGGGAAPLGNGDVNGDGAIDVSDATFLLGWLFRGGPAPVPCPGGSGLPDTGQTTCYALDGRLMSCTNFVSTSCPHFGQDGPQVTGCPSESSRFTVNADDTVTDNCTGLQWQRFTTDVDGDFETTANDLFDWCGAIKHCQELSFAGHEDWRLPNARELESIVDYGERNPAVHPVFRAYNSWYWTSTTLVGSSTAFVVNFESGISEVLGKETVLALVRAVRGGK